MARPIWRGMISFGLVIVPVSLFPAEQSHQLAFSMLDQRDFSPVGYKRYNKTTGKEVPWKDIVKGYEYEKDQYVVLSDEDFRRANVQQAKSVDIATFVDAGAIPPEYFETPYYLVPDKGGEKPYALLREAIRRTSVVGIGKVTLRTNNLHLVGVKTIGDAMVLEIMRFGGELVDVDELSFPGDSGLRPQELQMAEQLIENLSGKFDPSKYVDDYRANLMKIIRAKLKGKKIEKPEPEARETTQVIDLMARLQESLDASRGAHKAAQHRPHAAAKRKRVHTTHRTRRTSRKTA